MIRDYLEVITNEAKITIQEKVKGRSYRDFEGFDFVNEQMIFDLDKFGRVLKFQVCEINLNSERLEDIMEE